jgi:hypothetical protein
VNSTFLEFWLVISLPALEAFQSVYPPVDPKGINRKHSMTSLSSQK